MKKLLLTAVCVSVLALGMSQVQAADDMPPPPPAPQGELLPPPPPAPEMDKKMEKRMSKRLADDLGLTKEQQEKAEKIRKDGREKLKPLFEEMKDIREKMDKIREDNMMEFEKILTPEQKETLRGIKDHHREMMKEHRKHMKPRYEKRRHHIDD